jgi:hypothetical protein
MIYLIYPPPPGFNSDGCTVPRFLRGLYARYTKACRWHDWARRHLVHHKVMTVEEADWEWRRYMKDTAATRGKLYRNTIGRLLPQLAWVFVKLSRDRYSRTLAVRPEWVSYLKPVGHC